MFPTAKIIPYQNIEDGFQLYDDKECDLMALGATESIEQIVMDGLCNRSLVFTEDVVTTIPVAWPVSEELEGIVSQGLVQAKVNNGLNVDDHYQNGKTTGNCLLDFNSQDQEVSDVLPLTVVNMFLPFTFLSLCALTSVVVQLLDYGKKKVHFYEDASPTIVSVDTSKQEFSANKEKVGCGVEVNSNGNETSNLMIVPMNGADMSVSVEILKQESSANKKNVCFVEEHCHGNKTSNLILVPMIIVPRCGDESLVERSILDVVRKMKESA